MLRVSLRTSLRSKVFSYCHSGFSPCPNSAHVFTRQHLQLSPAEMEPGQLRMLLKIPSLPGSSHPRGFFWATLCSNLAPAEEEQSSAPASALKLEEGEHPPLLSFNLCSEGFVLIKLYSTL